jgi:O-antigen ligase
VWIKYHYDIIYIFIYYYEFILKLFSCFEVSVTVLRNIKATSKEGWETASFWWWCAALLYMTAPLEIILTGSDPDQGLSNPLPYYKYSRIFLSLFAIYFSNKNNKSFLILNSSALYILFFIFEFIYASMFAESGSTLTFAMAVFSGIAVAYGAAVHLGSSRLAKCTLYMLIAAVGLSIITAVFLPTVGVHNGHDLTGGAGRAGEWRGLYLHKNALGHLSGITLGILLCHGRHFIKNIYVLLAAILASALCVIMSHSSSSIVLFITVPLFYYIIISPKGWGRVAMSISALFTLVVLVPYREDIISFALELVGKKENLSGRSSIWHLAREMLNENTLLGHGMGYTASPQFTLRVTSLFGVNNVHNAYLDIAINYGMVGLIAFLLAVGFIAAKAWTTPQPASRERARTFFLTLIGAWAISGMSEVMAVRSYGVIAQIGVISIMGLCAVTVRTKR